MSPKPRVSPAVLCVVAAGFAASAASMTGCVGGEVDDAITTDFGDAMAITEVMGSGDVDTVLVSSVTDNVLGHLYWRADTGTVDMALGDRDIGFDGVMSLSEADALEIHRLMYALYEVDGTAGSDGICVGNRLATCCANADAWSCGPR